MTMYAGLDVSDKTTHICVIDGDGGVVRRDVVASDPQVLARWLKRHCPALVRVVLETASSGDTTGYSHWALSNSPHNQQPPTSPPSAAGLRWRRSPVQTEVTATPHTPSTEFPAIPIASPAAQVAWVPAQIRSGRTMRQTGPSAIRWASISQHSERSASRSAT